MTDKFISAPQKSIIDTATLAVLLRSDVTLHLFDARGDAEGIEMIPHACRLEVRCSPTSVNRIVGSENTLIVIYGTNLHFPASKELYKHLRNIGYDNVLEYQEGVEGWKAAGYPVVKKGES